MLYPDELRDRMLIVACLMLVLKPVPTWAASHPCLDGEVIAAPGGDVVAAGMAWPSGAKRPATTGLGVVATERKRDRYGRWRGFLVGDGEAEPRQVAWLRAGLGFAEPYRVKPVCFETLLAAEAEARAAQRGLWRRVRMERANDPSLVDRADRFAVVEGKIVSVGDRSRRVYLNFGTFWRQDFTVRIDKRDLKRHPELLARLIRAEGRTVRVRGQLELRDGPFMRVRDAGQIEIMGEPDG